MRRLAVVLALMALAPVGWLGVAPAATGPAGSFQAMGDFNGDGFDDLAVGAPRDNESGVDDSGAVNVIYGSASGLTDVGNQLWVQNAATLQDPPEDEDGFGGPVMAGDFNGDGFDDLAIAAPMEDVGLIEGAGVVHVLFGSGSGLTADDDILLARGVESGVFGFSLAAGDIDRDGHDDLVVGSPGDDVNGISGGSVHVLYGTDDGISFANGRRFHQAASGIAGVPNEGEAFGISVALGDFGRSPGLDLAIGVPGERTGGERGGAVAVLYTSRGQIRSEGDQLWHQDRRGVPGRARADDLFGFAVAAGNLGGSSEGDLAVGAPEGFPGEEGGRGEVQVLRGSGNGLTSAGSQLWDQGTRGIVGEPHQDESFGVSLAIGNFGQTRHADLAVGVPGDVVDMTEAAGAVNVIYGGPAGPTARGDQLWHQGKVAGDLVEMEDRFGLSLAVGNFGDGRRADLAIGVPAEDSASGVVLVLSGRPTGLRADAAEYWDQDSPNILGTSSAGDIFGFFGPCVPV